MPHATDTPQTTMRFVQLAETPHAAVIGDLLSAGAEVAQYEQAMWIRLAACHQDSQAILSKLVGQHWINGCGEKLGHHEGDMHSEMLLRRPEQQVPTASLPTSLQWKPVDEVFRFALPTAALGVHAVLKDRPPLRLVRGGKSRTAAAISVSLIELAEWAATAAAVRMQPLRWLYRGNQALVFGEPLPLLKGRMLVAREQVLVPIGFEWQPRLPSLAVLQAFSAVEQRDPFAAWLIWETDDSWCIVNDSDWIALTRASVRAAIELAAMELAAMELAAIEQAEGEN